MENSPQPTPIVNTQTSNAKPTPSQPVLAQNSPVMGSFFERLVAAIIDVFVVSFASAIISVPLSLVLAQGSDRVAIGTAFLPSIIQLGVFTGYYVYFYTQKGQSLGKMVMKLKVVNSADLKYLTPARVILRELIGKLASSIFFDLGYFWYFMSEKRQTWHDSIASTYVVKTDEDGQILMNGQSKYQKKPVLAFLPCGCLGLLVIVILFTFGAALITAINPTKQIEKATEAQQYKEDLLNDNTGNDIYNANTNSVDFEN